LFAPVAMKASLEKTPRGNLFHAGLSVILWLLVFSVAFAIAVSVAIRIPISISVVVPIAVGSMALVVRHGDKQIRNGRIAGFIHGLHCNGIDAATLVLARALGPYLSREVAGYFP